MWAQLRDDGCAMAYTTRISRRCRQPVLSLYQPCHVEYSSDCGESRDTQEGKTGRVYYPAPFMTNENLGCIRTLTKSAQKRSSTPTRKDSPCRSGAVADAVFPRYRHHRDINKAQIYAWRKGIKTLYSFACVRWRWKALKLKAASPVTLRNIYETLTYQRHQLEQDIDDKDLEVWNRLTSNFWLPERCHCRTIFLHGRH